MSRVTSTRLLTVAVVVVLALLLIALFGCCTAFYPGEPLGPGREGP